MMMLIIAAGAALGKGPGGLGEEHELVPAERVVEQAGEGDGVAKDLERGDGGAPDQDGDDDEEDVLEDAGQGHDEAGGFADLLMVVKG